MRGYIIRVVKGTTPMSIKSAIYKNSVGHLQASMAYGVVAAGCTGRSFKSEDLVIVLEDCNEDYMYGALCIAEGSQDTDSGYQNIWPNWQPNNPNKVVINKVKFITQIVIVPKSIIGRLTQTDIANINRKSVIDYIFNK